MAEDKDKNGEIIFFDKSIILDLTLKHIKIPLYHPSFFFARKWLDLTFPHQVLTWFASFSVFAIILALAEMQLVTAVPI